MSARSPGAAVFVAIFVALLAVTGLRAVAQQSDDHPLARIKKHEQELEKKIETERDRPDKKQHAKKVVDHAEQNIRDLGEQIKGAGHEIGAAAKDDQGKPGHRARGAAPPAPKKRAQSAGAPSNASQTTAGAAGASGASSNAPPTPTR